jgi:hypothetical protein
VLRTSLLVVLAAALAACQVTNPYAPHALAETPTDEAVEGRSTWAVPLVVPGSTVRVVPFAREREVHWFGDRDHFVEGPYAVQRGHYLGSQRASPADSEERRTSAGELRWHNAVVVDLADGSQWPLLDQRGVLSHYWMRLDRTDDGSMRGTALMLSATVEDSNGDGKLDSLDASRALVVETDERRARFVSPEGTQLRDVLYDPALDVAILMLASDSDGDGRFTALEAPEPFVLDLETGAPLRRLIDDETAQRVEAALDSPRK